MQKFHVSKPLFIKTHQPVQVGGAAAWVGNDVNRRFNFYISVIEIKHFINQPEKQIDYLLNKINQCEKKSNENKFRIEWLRKKHDAVTSEKYAVAYIVKRCMKVNHKTILHLRSKKNKYE